jgi:hypothetical protein
MFNSLRDYSNPSSLGSKFRRKRFKNIEALVRKVLSVKDKCKILDVGGTAQYWSLMEPELLRKCEIVVHNLEKPMGSDPHKNVPPNGVFKFDYGDGRNLNTVKDHEYDIAHSNSVIEHVGKFSDMQQFADELTRVGKYYYLQTPNFWFPIEPHYGVPFIHWLPIPVRARIMVKWNIGFHKKHSTLSSAYNYVEYINLIDQNALKFILTGADFRKEKILFLTKSLIAMSPTMK